KPKKKKWVMCCPKDLKKQPPKKVEKPLPPTVVKCEKLEKPPKTPKPRPEPHCERSKSYRSPAEQRAYLEKEAVPIFMEGMLELAREQPQDPISYLQNFWLKRQHECAIPLPKNLL
ncbi:hypothetical protein KR093_009801, partial [Drosophila rubida]